jgi:glycerophosphoryl diester phosphodiesterase
MFTSSLPQKLAIAAVVSTLAMISGPVSASFMVIAHRGDSINAPENTLASINSAFGKATHTEMDGRTTSDGHLVLMHDGTVDRTTDGTGTVVSKTLAQVQTLDAGSWVSPAFTGEPVPTVTQAVSTALSGGLTPVVERKTGTPQQYLNALAGVENDVAVIAFDLDFLMGVRALNPTILLGLLGSGAMSQTVVSNAVAGGIDFLSWNVAGITQDRLDVAHLAGLQVAAWTVDDPVVMQNLIDMGVDGITTNNPALLQSLVPEPNSLMLFSTVALLGLRRRKC